ncbi:MAG TPA: response regulator [Gaiellaceae bacterium]|nr:response regulator [Gaiellaceae bacterium]
MDGGSSARRVLLATFVRDAALRTKRAEHALADLAEPGGARAASAMAALAHEAHALRGGAATVGLSDVEALASELDQVLAGWQADSPSATDALVTTAERLLARVRELPAEATADLEPRLTEPSPNGSVVLHIEDHASNLKLVELVIRRLPGVVLVEAQTGADGLALAAELAPSLVLLDLRLPDIPGEEVLHRLRGNEPTKQTPVVVVSAEARPAEADRLLAAGADDFLVKPIDVAALLALVDQALDKTRP